MIAIYALIVLICLTAVLKIGLDINETLRIRRIRQTVMDLASRHYQPSLLIIVQYSAVEATLALLDQLVDYATLPPNTKVVVLLDSKYDKPKAVILRRTVRQKYSSIAAVSCIKNPDLLSYAKRRRSDFDLVTALPDTARLATNMYQAIVLPLGDPRLQAVSAPGAIMPQSTLVSAWQSIVAMLGSRLVPHQTSPATILRIGGVIRATSLSKKQVGRVMLAAPMYAQLASDATQTRLTIKRDWPVAIPGIVLLATLLTSLNSRYASLALAIALATTYYVTWILSSRRQLSLYQRIVLMLVAPFVFIGLIMPVLIAPAAHRLKSAIRLSAIKRYTYDAIR